MEKKLLIGTRPHYYRGQLLLEDDFIAEQDYHAAGRRRHTLDLHGWGVVHGLDVAVEGDNAIRIGAGLAVDGNGHDLALRDATVLDLSAAGAGAVLSVALVYEDEPITQDNEAQRSRRSWCVLRAATGIADAAVVLATVTLDQHGRLGPDAIDTARRRELPGLQQRGWARMPFRPVAMLPDKDKPGSKAPPAFLVGATRAQAEEGGARGTMVITVPPQASRIHRVRIAGEQNAKGMQVKVWTGGWDTAGRLHVKRPTLDRRLEPESPFDQTFDIAAADAALDPESSTLSLEIHGDGACFISLVAVEFSWRVQRW